MSGKGVPGLALAHDLALADQHALDLAVGAQLLVLLAEQILQGLHHVALPPVWMIYLKWENAVIMAGPGRVG